MSLVTAPELDAPVNDWSELLQSGSNGFEELLNGLFDEMEAMCRTLDEQREFYEHRCQQIEAEKQRLSKALAQRSPAESSADPELQSKVNELEQDRKALEEELEEVRSRAADLANTVNEQKRQMADERAEWSSELRQMRRVLDKQASWISQQSRQPSAYIAGPGEMPIAPTMPVQNIQGQPAIANPNGYPAPAPSAANRDPVLGSVLTQFELLRKDLERRRAPPKAGGSKNVNAS